jgi:hypothetical protein
MRKKDKMTNNDPQITTKKTNDCATNTIDTSKLVVGGYKKGEDNIPEYL